MGEEQYELVKNDQDEIIYELALLNFNEDELISDVDVKFMENIIKEYIDVLVKSRNTALFIDLLSW
jgi:hypothetical protein